MDFYSLFLSLALGTVATLLVYAVTGWTAIKNCYLMWFQRSYWTNYNLIEAVSWAVKAIIIVPGLIFQVQIWQLYFLALVTSMLLIWASNRKLLPTLVGFNTLWIYISVFVLVLNIT